MKPIERISVVEQVIQNVKEYIVNAKLVQGDKLLTEKEICETFGVGRSTAREAYRMMQAIGMIEIKRGKGVYFIKFPNEQIDDKYVALWFKENAPRLTDYIELRMAIETMATKLAIVRMSDKHLEQLCMIQALFVDSAKSKNYIKMAFYDGEFHQKIAEATGNELINKIEKMIAECIVDFRVQTYSIADNVDHAVFSHNKILEAFKSRDPDDAVRLMEKHLEDSLVDMRKVVSESEASDSIK